ncbi:MAG TPA: cation:proton antiporter [Acidimicrobiales bacterium]|jgi:CPA2 family monovalent cation:H+ antiporter-2|nr:cation:proton antiporter [Acidimicrobiales bacterium]
MHTATFFVELGAVILSLGVLARLAGMVGLSPVPFYLLAGLAFGSGGLIPLVTTRDFIQTGAQIGVVLLLLVLGIEYSAQELITNLRTHASTGVIDLVLNSVPGIVAGLLLGWGPVSTLALAGVTAVSSSGIISKVISDLGRLGNRETPAVLSVLVFEDLAMAIYLPVLTGLLAQKALGTTVLSVGVALVALAVVMVLSLRFGSVLSRAIFSPNNEVLLLQVLGLTLLVAGVAEHLEISAGVGAFLVGIALSGRVAERTRPILTPLRDIFAAVFFVFFGLQTVPSSLVSSLGPAALLGLAGVASKLITGWVAARKAGVAVPGRIRAGTSLIARGEFSVVIAGLALGSGLEPRLGPLATAYVILMAVIGPIATRVADPLTRRFYRPKAVPR